MRALLFRISRRLDRGLLPFMGPAQLGAGHAEEPYRAPADPACPVCARPLREHTIRRGAGSSQPTRFRCP